MRTVAGMDDHDRGLSFDLATLVSRRRALTLLGGVGLATLVGCGSDPKSSSAASSSTSSTTTAAAGSAAACSTIPEETGGPFPGDGTNGPNVLTERDIVRRDITSSFGSSTTKAGGIPTTIKLSLQDTANGCGALDGAAVYLWHCDREGRYSLYSQGVTGENYLRGVQVADADGLVTFTSIFPACYTGRWPHIHFEVYTSLDDATGGGSPSTTSQLAIPKDVCDVAFATSGYEQSVQNLSQISLSSDMVFRDDGAAHQLASVSGGGADGYTFELTVPV